MITPAIDTIIPTVIFSTDVFIQGQFKYHLTVQKTGNTIADSNFSCVLTEIAGTDHPPVKFDIVKDRSGQWIDKKEGVTKYSREINELINARYADLMT